MTKQDYETMLIKQVRISVARSKWERMSGGIGCAGCQNVAYEACRKLVKVRLRHKRQHSMIVRLEMPATIYADLYTHAMFQDVNLNILGSWIDRIPAEAEYDINHNLQKQIDRIIENCSDAKDLIYKHVKFSFIEEE